MSDYKSPVVWAKPTGIASDKDASRITRLKAYRDNHTTVLANGVRPIPNIKTMIAILDCFDMFDAHLIVETGDFRVAS